MKHFLLVLTCATFATALAVGCSDESTPPRAGQTLIESNPMAEVQAEVNRSPNDADAWYHLADLYERSGMYQEEAEALRKVIELDPKRGYAYAKLGSAYNRLNRYPDAITHFKKAAKLLPKNPVVYNNLAYAYGRTGQVEDQIAALKRAIAIRPSYATARYNLGIVYLRQKDRAGALRQYEELRKIDETAAESLKKEIDGAKRG